MNFKSLLNKSAINLSFQIVPALCALVMVPLTLSWYGKELFSLYSLAVSVVVLFNYLNFGVAQAANRELAKIVGKGDKGRENSLITTSFFLIIAIGVLICVTSFAFQKEILSSVLSNDQIFLDQAQNLIMGVLYCSPIFLIVILLRSILESKFKFVTTGLNRAVLNSVIFISPAICKLNELGIDFSIYIIAVVHVISIVFLLTRVLKEYGGYKFTLDFSHCRVLLISGFWMTIISLSGIILLYMDKFIISSLLGLKILALYVVAYDLISRTSLIYGSISAVFYPAFSRLYSHKDFDALTRTMNQLTNVVLTILIPFITTVIIFSDLILSTWIDDNVSQNASPILQYLAIGILFNGVSSAYQRALNACDYERQQALFYTLLSGLYFASSIILTIYFGLVGVCVAFVTKGVLEAISLSVLFNNRVGRYSKYAISVRRQILTVVSLLVFMIGMLLARERFEITWQLLIPVYIASAYIFYKEVTKQAYKEVGTL